MRTQGREGGGGIYTRGASSDSLGLVSKILLLNRSLSLFLVQLQAVPEQRNLILVVFKTTTLAFHGADLRPRDLRARVWEGALSDHVACLATSEAGAHHSGGTVALPHHGITAIGGPAAAGHPQRWWETYWGEGQGWRPEAGLGGLVGQRLGEGAVLPEKSGCGGQ